MANAERQMPGHVEAAYKDAADNIIFLKRQQWVATNYALLAYAAIFVISAEYFSRTDFARNSLGIIAIAVFVIHCYVIFVFQRAIDKFRSRDRKSTRLNSSHLVISYAVFCLKK